MRLRLIGVNLEDRFMLITLVPTQEQAIYWLGNGSPPQDVPAKFESNFTIMKTGHPHAVDELTGIGFYKSDSDGKVATSQMVFTVTSSAGRDTIRTNMNTHFVEDDSNAHAMLGMEVMLVQNQVVNL